MEISYKKNWNRLFAKRLRTGRLIQRFFGNRFWSGFLVRALKPFPYFMRSLIRHTHGQRF
jgi:hypothetical protein